MGTAARAQAAIDEEAVRFQAIRGWGTGW
jgi:hypothetical protein